MINIKQLIASDDLASDEFVMLDNGILSQANYIDCLHDIIGINRKTNWIQNYDDFPTRKFEYPWAFYSTRITQGMKVADMGCSLDPFAPLLAKAGLNTHALDMFSSHDEGWDPILGFRNGKYVGKQKMDVFQNLLQKELSIDVQYLNADMSSTDFTENYFDRIYSISVLEHLPKYKIKIVLQEWARILKNDGLIILTIDYIIGQNKLFNIGKMIKMAGYKLHGKVNLFPASTSTMDIVVAAFVLSPRLGASTPNLFSKIYRRNRNLRMLYDGLYDTASKLISRIKNYLQ